MPEPAPQAEAAPPRRRGRPRLDQPSQEYLARLEEIIDAAVEVFRVRGYDSATLDDVAAAIDVRRASLYHYVPSKAHLLSLVLDRAISTAIRQLEESRRIDDPRERLIAFIKAHVLLVAQQPGLLKVFFDDRSALEERYEAEIVEKERRYLRELVALVKDAVDGGVLPPVDSRYGAQVLLGTTTWHYKWFDPDRHDPNAVVNACIALLLGGNFERTSD